jgi:hypothetical protein
LLEEPVIKRLTLCRYLFEIAVQNARSDQEVAGAACVNLIQDAIEIFLLAAADHLNIPIAARTDFVQYLDKINEKIGDVLPFRLRLIEINRVRVAAKHHGIPPNRREIQGYVSDARKFLEQASKRVMNVDFWSVSLLQLLDDNDTKKHLLQAESAFVAGIHDECHVGRHFISNLKAGMTFGRMKSHLDSFLEAGHLTMQGLKNGRKRTSQHHLITLFWTTAVLMRTLRKKALITPYFGTYGV